MAQIDIGDATLQAFTIGSHNWGQGMNQNMLKASVLINPTVQTRTDTLPDPVPFEGYAVLWTGTPRNDFIRVHYFGDWYNIEPVQGLRMFVEDEGVIYIYRGAQWNALQNVTVGGTDRQVAFYHPVGLPTDAVIFHQVTTVDFALDVGASIATLETAPTSELVLDYQIGGNPGTITFAANSTSGTFSGGGSTGTLPSDIVVSFDGNDAFGARGLSITFRGNS